MERYAIWKNKKIIGYIELTEEQAKRLNGISGIGLHLRINNTTKPGNKWEDPFKYTSDWAIANGYM